jgi:hypothetical protein
LISTGIEIAASLVWLWLTDGQALTDPAGASLQHFTSAGLTRVGHFTEGAAPMRIVERLNGTTALPSRAPRERHT